MSSLNHLFGRVMKKLALYAVFGAFITQGHQTSANYQNIREYGKEYYILESGDSVKIFETDTHINKIISGRVKIFVIPKDKMKFEVSTSRPNEHDFYLNSNFFSNEGPLGLVVVDGERVSRRVKKGGYFYVKNGKPFVKAHNSPRMTEFNSQTILVGIDNGQINDKLIEQSHAKDKNYRSLVGEDTDGNIIIIVSSFLGLTTINDIVKIGKDFNVHNGVLFDGGSSVDFKLNSHKSRHYFKSVPAFLKEHLEISEPTTYICGNFIQ